MSLELWNKVQETDPNYTKGFTRGGGFSGTAINPTYLVKKATEMWGPIGGAWGYQITAEDYRDGAPHVVSETIMAREVIHVVRIEFRHPDGKFESFGQTTFVGRNKNGWFTDEEAPKKSLTDALTKALSLLGFSADIHHKMYDDSKYVADLKKKYADAPTDPASDAEAKRAADAGSMRPNSARDVAVEAFTSMSPEEQDFLSSHAREIQRLFDAKGDFSKYLVDQKFDNEEKLALWSLLPSNVRSAIKKQAAQPVAEATA